MDSETEQIQTLIKSISIRGRYAFGVKCIQQFLEEQKIKGKWIDRLILVLKEFTNTDKLDEWDDKISELDPENILDKHPDNKAEDYQSLTDQEFNDLQNFYNSLPNQLTKLISNVIYIGTGNLYGGTGSYSEPTFETTLKVIEQSKNILSTPPNINNFTFSKFSEFHGWGNNFKIQ